VSSDRPFQVRFPQPEANRLRQVARLLHRPYFRIIPRFYSFADEGVGKLRVVSRGRLRREFEVGNFPRRRGVAPVILRPFAFEKRRVEGVGEEIKLMGLPRAEPFERAFKLPDGRGELRGKGVWIA